MKNRSIVALSLVVVLAAALTAATSGATQKAAANSITVWLQVDAQSGWPDVVAAANRQFQSDHPGTTKGYTHKPNSDSYDLAFVDPVFFSFTTGALASAGRSTRNAYGMRRTTLFPRSTTKP